MVLKYSINLRKELMSLCNLFKMLRFPIIFRSELNISSGNCDSTYAKSTLEGN